MKLKKIASLALAGTMAVSMLAACGDKAGSSNSGEELPTTSVASIVEAVNNGQSGANMVKVTFTDDSYLDSTLQKIVEKMGVSATSTNVKTALSSLVGETATTKSAGWGRLGAVANAATEIGDQVSGQFLNEVVEYNNTTYTENGQQSEIGALDGDTYVVFGVKKYAGTSYYTEDAALKAAAADVNKFVAKLAATSDDEDKDGKLNTDVVVGGANNADKYYTYSYDGSVAMTSVTNLNGTVDYYVAIVMHQNVAKTTLE